MEEQDADVICEQCRNVPLQFVILDCDHKFCLYCLSHAFHQDDSGVSCLKCNQATLLDAETLGALLETKLNAIQPIKPFTTEKRAHIKPAVEDIVIKGHPFIEKLNLAIERTLDTMRTLQFDKMTVKEKCQKARGEMENEFKQLHMHLDSKQEQFLNQLSYFESHYVNQLAESEQAQQIDIEEMQIMKDEIKSMLVKYDGIHEDISQFKAVLGQVDQIVQKKQLSIFQLGQKEIKLIQEELQELQKKWGVFYQDYRSFFSQQSSHNPIPQFITQTRLERLQQLSYSSGKSILKESNFKKSIMIHSANKTLLSPNRNSFLNDEINLTRKLSKIEVTHSRLLNSSPLDPKIVLHNSIKRIHKNNGSFGASQFQSYLN